MANASIGGLVSGLDTATSLGEDALMHIRTLAHVQSGEVEAENLGGTLEDRKSRFDQNSTVVCFQ